MELRKRNKYPLFSTCTSSYTYIVKICISSSRMRSNCVTCEYICRGTECTHNMITKHAHIDSLFPPPDTEQGRNNVYLGMNMSVIVIMY